MKKYISLLLSLIMLLSLCACGTKPAESATQSEPVDSAEDSDMAEVEDPVLEPVPEPTPEAPKTFMEEHDLGWSMQFSSTQPGAQRADSGSDTLSPEFCRASCAVVSVERSAPDEEGYVVYTIISEGSLLINGDYVDADGDNEAGLRCSIGGYGILDRYTGTELPGRATLNDDAYDYSVDVDWNGEHYTLSRAVSVKWDGSVSANRSTEPWKYYGHEYYHKTEQVKVPAEYDGLTLTWYAGTPEPIKPDDDSYELDLEQHLFCEDEPEKLTDYRYVSLDAVLSALGGGTETPAPAALSGRIDDEAYQDAFEWYDSEEYWSLNQSAQKFSRDWSTGVEDTQEAFALRPKNNPFDRFELFDLGEVAWSTREIEDATERTPISVVDSQFVDDDPYPETFDEVDGFILENRSQDLQIALKVFDQDGTLLGCSGLLGPGEYLTRFTLDTPARTLPVTEYRYYIGDQTTIHQDGTEETKHVNTADRYLIRQPDCVLILCVYDMDGNLLATNSLDNINYGNAYSVDWDEIE